VVELFFIINIEYINWKFTAQRFGLIIDLSGCLIFNLMTLKNIMLE